MEKIMMFSHGADIDGIGCIILGKMAFGNIDYDLLPNPEKLELKFRNYIGSNKFGEYEKVYVTDLALYDPALTMVANSFLKDKVRIFDHHKKSVDDHMNRYSFTTIIVKDEHGKRCGTSLFYEYLVKNKFLNRTHSLDVFVEMTRQEDTWEWKKYGKFGEESHDLAVLFNIIGVECYIDRMIGKLKSKLDFSFNDEEKALIANKKLEYDKKLNEIISQCEYFYDEYRNKFGIVFADYEYRNEIPEYVLRTGNPEKIKYIVIAAMDMGDFGQKSYRSIDESFDVNKVATRYGGGGHMTASRVNITKEQRDKVFQLPKKDRLRYLASSKYLVNEELER